MQYYIRFTSCFLLYLLHWYSSHISHVGVWSISASAYDRRYRCRSFSFFFLSCFVASFFLRSSFFPFFLFFFILFSFFFHSFLFLPFSPTQTRRLIHVTRLRHLLAPSGVHSLLSRIQPNLVVLQRSSSRKLFTQLEEVGGSRCERLLNTSLDGCTL